MATRTTNMRATALTVPKDRKSWRRREYLVLRHVFRIIVDPSTLTSRNDGACPMSDRAAVVPLPSPPFAGPPSAVFSLWLSSPAPPLAAIESTGAVSTAACCDWPLVDGGRSELLPAGASAPEEALAVVRAAAPTTAFADSPHWDCSSLFVLENPEVEVLLPADRSELLD